MKTIRNILWTFFSILIPLGLFMALHHEAPIPNQGSRRPIVKKSQEEQIQAAIGKNMKKIVACYNQRLRHGLDKMGDLKVAWDIDEDGVAHDVRLVENQLEDQELYECSAQSIGQWTFPKGIYFKVHYDFHLKYEKPMTASNSEATREMASEKEDD